MNEAAVAVDLGGYSADRRDLQNKADAIALAASQELPNADAAHSVALQWAGKNGIDVSDLTITIVPQSLPGQANPEVQIAVKDDHSFVFARLIGVSSASVGASAAAIKTSPSGGSGVIPLAVTEAAIAGVTVPEPITLKYDANNIENGNTGPIVVDGVGSGSCPHSNLYCAGVTFGSESVICAEGTDGTYCDGPSTTDTQPGNITGPTSDAISYRINNTSVECDEFGEVFEDDPTTSEPDVYRIVNECNPFLEGGYSSLRVLIVPVIDELCNGSCEVTITRFVLAFLEGFGSGGCSGNDCEIVARFVRVNQNVGLLAGTFDPEGFNHFVRLVQ